MEFKGKLELKDIGTLMAARGLGKNGKVQRFIDSEVLRLSDPYVPMDTGKLKQSGTQHTRIGSGDVQYKTPYARRQYYENRGSGTRGKLWFERMKGNHKDQILRGAANVAGGRGEKQ